MSRTVKPSIMNSISITTPDDLHLHLRDGEALRSVVNDSARQFARAIIMPNLKPPVVTVKQALEYRERILACVNTDSDFQPLMTLYLTDLTKVDEIERIRDCESVHAVKYYPAGATTNSEHGVTNIANCMSVFEKMAEQGVPLLIHGEVTDSEVDIFDREAVFIETVLEPLKKNLPELRIVLEHITTADAVDYVKEADEGMAATITPHHLSLNRNAIFEGGIRPHNYCLPVLKRETHRQALREIVKKRHKRFFLGTDSAPHVRGAKENDCGCAGIYSAYNAMEIYTEIFEELDVLDGLEDFCSHFGADFYGLPRNTGTIKLEKQSWTVPESLPFANEEIVPMRAGQTCCWKLVSRS